MFKAFSPFFLIMGSTGMTLLVFILYFFLTRRKRCNKQTFSHYQEEIGNLSGRIKRGKAILIELENENRLLLTQINQMKVDRCKNHPLLKKIYDKTCIFSTFTDVEWMEFMQAFESVYPHFTTKLQKCHPKMSVRDVRICVLAVMKVKPAKVADIMNLQSDTLSSYKQKIKKDCFGITGKKTLEYFLLKYVAE